VTDWTPSFLPSGNLSGWYKADAITGKSDGDAVDSWTDSSGRSNTLTQSTAGAQPSYETDEINTLPIVRFDKDASPGDNVFSADLGGDFEPGTGDFFVALVVKFVSTGTQFIMSKADSGVQGLNMFISGSNLLFRPQTVGVTTNNIRQDSVVDSAFHVVVCRRVSGTLGSQFDGSPFTTDDGSKINNGSIANDANFNVGSSSTGGLDVDMDLAEALIAVGTLSDANMDRMTGYLAHKYALTANLPADHPFKTNGPKVHSGTIGFGGGLISGGLIS
jgi:hypothetical protein